ncbi:MAG: DUF3883 domain-containing protein [Bacteroidota bacterium]|nr:DUF3883 domain-containing protein [Bacteroidota bacterium]
MGSNTAEEKVQKKQARIVELKQKKAERIERLKLMRQLSPKAPEILGCAFVIPLTQVEYANHYGMSRDDEVEAIAMEIALKYESDNGWKPQDVSKNNEGFDIRSINPEGLKRYIEVKGRAGEGGVMISRE